MSEWTLHWLAISKLLWLVGYACFYSLGGMSAKWRRRILGSFWLVGGVVLFNVLEHHFSWWLLTYWPLLWLATSQGYGASATRAKIRRRMIYGLVVGVASLPVALVTGNWLLFSLHVALCAVVSTVLGVWNPTSAREEEVLIGTTSGLLPLYF